MPPPTDTHNYSETGHNGSRGSDRPRSIEGNEDANLRASHEAIFPRARSAEDAQAAGSHACRFGFDVHAVERAKSSEHATDRASWKGERQAELQRTDAGSVKPVDSRGRASSERRDHASSLRRPRIFRRIKARFSQLFGALGLQQRDDTARTKHLQGARPPFSSSRVA